MNHWLDSTLHQIQVGQALMAGGVGGLVYGLKVKAVGTLASGANRWQTAIRQIQYAPLSLADVLRARCSARK